MIPLVTLLNSNLSITMCWCCALMKLIGKPLFVSLKTTTAGLLTQSIYLRCGASLSLYRRRASKALTVAFVQTEIGERACISRWSERSSSVLQPIWCHDGVWCGRRTGVYWTRSRGGSSESRRGEWNNISKWCPQSVYMENQPILTLNLLAQLTTKHGLTAFPEI